MFVLFVLCGSVASVYGVLQVSGFVDEGPGRTTLKFAAGLSGLQYLGLFGFAGVVGPISEPLFAAAMYAPVSWVIYANLLKASGDYFERISSVSFGGVLSAALPMAILTHVGMLVASFLF